MKSLDFIWNFWSRHRFWTILRHVRAFHNRKHMDVIFTVLEALFQEILQFKSELVRPSVVSKTLNWPKVEPVCCQIRVFWIQSLFPIVTVHCEKYITWSWYLVEILLMKAVLIWCSISTIHGDPAEKFHDVQNLPIADFVPHDSWRKR